MARAELIESRWAFRVTRICEIFFFFSSRRRHTRFDCDWSSDVCSSDLEQWRAPLERRRPLDRISSGQLPGFRALVRGRRGHPARIPMPSLPQQPTPYQLRPFAACTCNPNPEPSCDEQQLRSEQAMLVLLLLATEVIPRTSHERRAYVLFERGSAMPILDLLTDILRRPRPRHGLRHQVFPGVPLHESEDTWRPAMRRACTRSQEEV